MRFATSFSRTAWDVFATRHPYGWFWHLRSWVDYQVAYRPGSRDESVVALGDDDELLGIAPIVRGPTGIPSYGGGPHPFPLATRVGVFQALVDVVAARGHTVFADNAFAAAPGSPVVLARHTAVTQGTTAHRVIDLTRLDWSTVRKSYHSLVNGAMKRYRVSFYVGDSPQTQDAFARYQALHRAVFSSPRPDFTYQAQAKWLEQDLAAVCLAEDDAGTWAGAYWFIYKGCAYYGSGPSQVRDGAQHAVIWHSLQSLAADGVKRVDMGAQGSGTTDKERAIEFFKTGFGGEDIPVRFAEVTP